MSTWSISGREYFHCIGLIRNADALCRNAEMAVRKMLKQSAEKLGTTTLSVRFFSRSDIPHFSPV